VDDPRYGRVRISRETFERVDFAPAGSGPGYRDFPVGSPLKGGVTTRDGRRLSGRLVFDLDESETTEMLDAPFEGVDYTIPFGLIASIAPHASDAAQASSAEDKALVRIRLRDGEELRLERSGDLGDGNGGMLIFAGSEEKPAYVPWADIAQIDFDPPLAMYPPPPSR
jgi:hypothetical protein